MIHFLVINYIENLYKYNHTASMPVQLRVCKIPITISDVATMLTLMFMLVEITKNYVLLAIIYNLDTYSYKQQQQ